MSGGRPLEGNDSLNEARAAPPSATHDRIDLTRAESQCQNSVRLLTAGFVVTLVARGD